MQGKILTLAGGLSLALAAVHLIGGGADVHEPILNSALDPVLKGFSSVIWHAVTANLLICSALLFWAARAPHLRSALTGIVAVHYAAYVGLFLFYGVTRFGDVLIMPPWIGFAVILAVIAGSMKRSGAQA